MRSLGAGADRISRSSSGWWQLIAVLEALVWDGEGVIGRWQGGKPELTAECQAFCAAVPPTGGLATTRDPPIGDLR